MLARKTIDLSAADLLRGMWYCLFPGSEAAARDRVSALFGRVPATPTLSVRSGFDALLQALRLPAGSEILVSAINVRGMFEIAALHGLRLVPVDIDFATLAIDPVALEARITPNTRAILVAHLFGGIANVEPLIEIARRHDLLVLEDCAQCFSGADGYLGNPRSDVAMFSFGPIKTCSAHGGGVLLIHDTGLRGRVEAVLAGYECRGNAWYLRRLWKYAVIRLLSSRRLYGLALRVLARLCDDYDRFLNRIARNFRLDRIADTVRRRPPPALVAQLAAKACAFDARRLDRRIAQAGELLQSLDCRIVPGHALTAHSRWLFPLCVREPRAFIESLKAAGIDATQGRHHLFTPGELFDDLAEELPVARFILSQAVYVPVHHRLSRRRRERIVAAAAALGDPWTGSDLSQAVVGGCSRK